MLSFTPDGHYLASSGMMYILMVTCALHTNLLGVDCTIRVWDLGLAVHVCEFKKHQAAIYSLMFSRDGSILASGEMTQH